jgi:signal transduction histidine kinase
MHREEPTIVLKALRRIRWPLAVIVGLIFAAGRFVETAMLGSWADSPVSKTLDPLGWGLIAALAVWGLISWMAGQEQRYRASQDRMLAELQRRNTTLAQLYEINQRIASSATLDEILDYATSLPAQLVQARATALVLFDETGAALTTRCVGFANEELEHMRAAFGLAEQPAQLETPHVLKAVPTSNVSSYRCLLMPLVEPGTRQAALGWIEAYCDAKAAYVNLQPEVFEQETKSLLITVAGELTEAILGARRRAREIESVTALEHAITAERTRIAHDLHDGIAQSLAFMRMRADLWEDWLRDDPSRLAGEFQTFKANVRTQIEELRRAIFALRPVELATLGFEGALLRFVRDFAGQQGWEVELNVNAPHHLPHVLELAAFRVVQEALTNAAKYAKANQVEVRLGLVDGGLQIVVRDDGVGFDASVQRDEPGKQIGLRQMRERAAALDGRVTVISQPGAGTEIRVWFPMMYGAENRE